MGFVKGARVGLRRLHEQTLPADFEGDKKIPGMRQHRIELIEWKAGYDRTGNDRVGAGRTQAAAWQSEQSEVLVQEPSGEVAAFKSPVGQDIRYDSVCKNPREQDKNQNRSFHSRCSPGTA